MYSAENYHWGLVGYYLGCLMLMLFICRFRKIVPGRHFRNLLLLFIATAILVPIYTYPGSSYFSPAWFVSIFEGLTGEAEQAYMRGVQPILVCYLAVVCFYIIWAILGYRRNQARVIKKSTKPIPE